VTFDFTGQPGSETSVTPTATVVSGGAITRASSLSANAGSGSINSANWPSAVDPNRYYTFTVTPTAGCTVSLTSLALDVRASGSGPTSGDVATSVDAFGAHFGQFAGTSAGSVSIAGVSSSGAIEIRIYGWGATSSAGTFRIQNTLTLSGSIN